VKVEEGVCKFSRDSSDGRGKGGLYALNEGVQQSNWLGRHKDRGFVGGGEHFEHRGEGLGGCHMRIQFPSLAAILPFLREGCCYTHSNQQNQTLQILVLNLNH